MPARAEAKDDAVNLLQMVPVSSRPVSAFRAVIGAGRGGPGRNGRRARPDAAPRPDACRAPGHHPWWGWDLRRPGNGTFAAFRPCAARIMLTANTR